jgi:hypothetical protein
VKDENISEIITEQYQSLQTKYLEKQTLNTEPRPTSEQRQEFDDRVQNILSAYTSFTIELYIKGRVRV